MTYTRRRLKTLPKRLNLQKKRKYKFWYILFILLIGFLMAIIISTIIFSHKIDLTIDQYNASEKKLTMISPPPEIKKKLESATQSATFNIPVLLYHYVEYVTDKRDTIRQSLDIIPFVFQHQLETLKDANYTFLTMSDVADIMDNKMQLPEKPIVITFDDGYRDFYTDVMPILKKENVKVVAFIVPGFLDHPNFMFKSEFQEIAKRRDLVEIAAHTMHHRYLKGLSKANQTEEIIESKVVLEEMTGRQVVSFAYPYGAFDDQALTIVKNAGFRTAVSTIPGKEENETNRFFIYRLRPGGRTGQALLNFLEQKKFKPW